MLTQWTDEVFALLGCSAAVVGIELLTFEDSLLVSFSGGPDSLSQYAYYQVMLCNILEERRPQPHHCESLKPHTVDRARETFLIIKATRYTNFSDLFLE